MLPFIFVVLGYVEEKVSFIFSNMVSEVIDKVVVVEAIS